MEAAPSALNTCQTAVVFPPKITVVVVGHHRSRMSATSTLRDALLETLLATQSFDVNIRSAAEEQLKILEVTDGE